MRIGERALRLPRPEKVREVYSRPVDEAFGGGAELA